MMSNNILRFCPGLNLDLIKSTLQDSYRQLCSKDWNRLKLTRQTYTTAIYSTGTVSIAADGTVTGSGTTFTSAMVGRHMSVYYDDAFFEIQTYLSPTSIILKDWAGEVVSGEAYTIFKIIYTIDPSFKLVWNVIHQIPLKKKSQSYFNSVDPGRTSTSSSPTAWALAGLSPTGAVQIEIYPVPTDVVPLRVYGKMGFSTLADGDSPRLPEDLIEAYSLITCYRLKDLKEPGQGWAEKIVIQNELYGSLLADLNEEDYQLGEHSDRVKDTMGEVGYPTDDNFALSHDVD